MAPRKPKTEPKYLIDIHGLRAALASTDNATRAAIIDAIESGMMRIVGGVEDDVEMFDDISYEFKSIKNKRYLRIDDVTSYATCVLMEAVGANPFGSIPEGWVYETIAMAQQHGLTLVSSGLALDSYKSVTKKLGTPMLKPISVTVLKNL